MPSCFGPSNIQIQHLLKLNAVNAKTPSGSSAIQIQHLLKLNLSNCFIYKYLEVNSNTTLVKVKYMYHN